MRILFIGGSNFVLKAGVISTIPSYLSESLAQDVIEVKNISVGGTGSLFGLHNLLELSESERFDFVFIEYGVNDYIPFKRNRTLWEAGFTTLVKTAKSKCPRAKLIVLLLGRREKQFFEVQKIMHSEMHRISTAIGATVVDVDTLFKSDKMGKLDFKSAYADSTHYKPPLATNLISAYTVMQTVGIGKITNLLSESLKNHTFRTYSFSSETNNNDKTIEFKNSLFEVKTETIKNGEELRLTTTHLPCALAFVSTKSSGSILINVNGQKAILHGAHRRVLSGDFSFLLRHVPLLWLNFNADTSTTSRQFDIQIRPIDSEDPEWDKSLIQPAYEMISVQPSAVKSVHLASMTLIE